MSSKLEATKNEPIFISYRFADKPIAEVIRKYLSFWGFNSIYQAGAGASAAKSARVGENLPDQLRKALDESQLVILVYTFADEDWSWCMWECGLASHPGKVDTTRVVVFQCTSIDTPKVFSDEVMVRVEDPNSIRDFTKQLHRDEDFFKGKLAYRPELSDTDLESISTAFYQELRSVIPSGQREERFRWDRFTLKLENPAGFIDIEPNEKTLQELQSELVVIHPFGNALKHFGYANPRDGLKLSDIVERWIQETRDRQNVSNDWIKELCLEIQRAIDDYPAKPQWQQLNSVVDREPYYPVINHMRILPDNSMEFDVYFYLGASGQEDAEDGPDS
jgi:hypothetical protein